MKSCAIRRSRTEISMQTQTLNAKPQICAIFCKNTQKTSDTHINTFLLFLSHHTPTDLNTSCMLHTYIHDITTSTPDSTQCCEVEPAVVLPPRLEVQTHWEPELDVCFHVQWNHTYSRCPTSCICQHLRRQIRV